MQITCNRNTLQKYITTADKVTSKNSSLPILNSVLITTDEREIIIRSTNLEVGVELRISATIKEKGSIALPGSLVSNILSSITDEELVTLSVIDGVCKITTKSKTLSVKGFLPDDFPTIPVISSEDTFLIPVKKFIQGIKAVSMSASLSDVKPEISSVYMYQQGDFIVFVATDSFRLSEKKVKHTGVVIPHGVIIPIKNISDIVRILELESGDILISVTKNQISFASKSLYITSRVVQGVYPDYEQIIPKTNTTEIVLLKEDLINTLKLSTLFSDKFNKIRIFVDPIKRICMVSTKNTDIGEVESNLTATLQGESIDIPLNGKHVYECLSVIDKDSISIQCNGPEKPAVIRGLGDQSFTYLTMPLSRV